MEHTRIERNRVVTHHLYVGNIRASFAWARKVTNYAVSACGVVYTSVYNNNKHSPTNARGIAAFTFVYICSLSLSLFSRESRHELANTNNGCILLLVCLRTRGHKLCLSINRNVARHLVSASSQCWAVRCSFSFELRCCVLCLRLSFEFSCSRVVHRYPIYTLWLVYIRSVTRARAQWHQHSAEAASS